jgi:hypothetical protein
MLTSDEAARLHRSLAALAMGFGRKLDDADYDRFEADLADLPIDRIEDACLHLRRHSKRFPTVAHIREQADLLPRHVPALPRAALPSTPDDPAYCAVCEDSGWELGLWCEGGSCGRTRAHGPHSYTRPCRCRSSNPVYRERHLSDQHYHREVD